MKTMFELTKRNLIRWRYVGIFFIGLFIGIALGELRFIGAWTFGWLCGMDWQKEKSNAAKIA